MTNQTREERLEALRKELATLKGELRKTKGSYMRSVLIDEIRGVCREIESLQGR